MPKAEVIIKPACAKLVVGENKGGGREDRNAAMFGLPGSSPLRQPLAQGFNVATNRLSDLIARLRANGGEAGAHVASRVDRDLNASIGRQALNRTAEACDTVLSS